MRNSRSGAPSNLDPRSSRSSLRFLSVKGTAASLLRGFGHETGQQARFAAAVFWPYDEKAFCEIEATVSAGHR
jgi:hypothetical protein